MKIILAGINSEGKFFSFESQRSDCILMAMIQGHFELWHRDYPNDSVCRVLTVDLYPDRNTVHIDLSRGHIDRAYNYFC